MTYNQLNDALTKLVSAARDMDTAHRFGTTAQAETEEYLRIRDSILQAFDEASMPKVWHGSGVWMGPGEEPGR